MKLYLTLLSCFLCVSYCSSSQIEQEIIEDDLLLEKATPSDTLAKMTDLGNIRHLIVINDSIMVSLKGFSVGDCVLEMRSLLTPSLVRKALVYGPGKDSVMSSVLSYNGDKLLINDFIKKNTTIVDSDYLKNGEKKNCRTYKAFIDSQRIIPVGGRRVLFLCPNSFDGNHKRIKSARLTSFRIKARTSPMIDVVHGYLQYNPHSHCSVYANSIESKVEIMDSHFRTKRIIIGPNYERMEYYIDNKGKYSYSGAVTSSYNGICSNDDFIALSYSYGKSKESKMDYSGYSIVLLLNWEGEIWKSFVTSSRIIDISMLQDGAYILCFEENKEGDRYLVKYATGK